MKKNCLQSTTLEMGKQQNCWVAGDKYKVISSATNSEAIDFDMQQQGHQKLFTAYEILTVHKCKIMILGDNWQSSDMHCFSRD